MVIKSTAFLRGIALATALMLGVSAAPQAFAAQDAAGLPEGLTGGASITYTGEDGFSTLLLNVFTFEDEDAAESGFDALIELTTGPVSAPSAEDSATPAATPAATPEPVMEVTELTDVPELEGLGDEARAFEIPFGSDVRLINLFIRDGANIHYWALVDADAAAFSADDATPAATPDDVEPIDILLGIALPWFDDGINRDGELIDQLPNVDAIPDGYTETEREDTIDLGN